MKLKAQRGYSLLEMMTAIAITFVLAGVTGAALVPMWKSEDVTNAYNATLTTLRRARDQAEGDMRIYVVTFANNTPNPSTITVQQAGPGNTTCTFSPTGTVLLTTTLPSDISFSTQSGIPTSNSYAAPPVTPDAFGTGGYAVDLDAVNNSFGVASVCFNPDGTATDNFGQLAGGVVYMSRSNDLYSSRAITLWGSTSRIRGWRLNSVSGVNTWQQQ